MDVERTNQQLRIIDFVKEVWIAHPELRFGQLISNMFYTVPGDSFYVPDAQVEEVFKLYAEKYAS